MEKGNSGYDDATCRHKVSVPVEAGNVTQHGPFERPDSRFVLRGDKVELNDQPSSREQP